MDAKWIAETALYVNGKYFGCVDGSKWGFSVYVKYNRDTEVFVGTKDTEAEAKELLERYAKADFKAA